ncbi:MAG: benzil reductase ((S)-benzoin forming) [Azoarcus sp.]|uniref:NAD(P)-dependent dehydrogenase, short-chain alcohol dehydrogenase family n=1 Tax=Aromatoleum tolulyticum TaxID=34027 RepID=A0A1N6N3K2_9RHOO|nr:SDR family oxidoreductase [Aromatoleum tolulyticum]MCK9983880.1 benzil reductase ((S)-benzoin forming) [Azoarcus sp.]SIP86632.1 NAD(P)-dependent dehydrogenase, short-chain alcohol dehydrogenase family [Aromatoleum tolulyticum]
MKAILTGHTQGLGAAIAEELLARTIPVLGLARHANDALAERYPDDLSQVRIDLADTDVVADWLAGETLRSFLANCSQALLINNAGMLQPVGQLDVLPPEAIARAIALNTATPLMLASAFTAASTAVADRRILHVSSGAARSAYAGWSVYCASKAALDQHARAAAMDGTPGLRICSLAPGVVDTAMQAEIRATPDDRFPVRARFEALKRDGALARPDECAFRLVNYLLGDEFGLAATADLRQLAP